MTDLITTALVRLDADSGSDKRGRDPGAGPRSSPTPAAPTTPTSSPRTRSPARGRRRPACRAASPSPTAARRASASPTLAFARLSPKVEFGAKDGPADLAFLIAAPAGGDATHLQLLTKLARALVKKDFTDGLRSADHPQEVVDLVLEVVGDAPATTPTAAAAPASAPAGGSRSLVAVTACPTGIAHTYMAAEALEAAADQGRRRDRRRDPGLGRLQAAAARDDRRRLRGDLRRRRRAYATAAGSPASRWSPRA